MSTPPTQDANTIANLQEQVANMARQIAILQSSRDSDPQLEEPISVKTYHPSAEEAERYPPIQPSDPASFFQQDTPDDEFWEQFRRYPKNSAMGYEPPKIPNVIPLSPPQKAHDHQLRNLQKRLVNLTRPIDMFLHQIWSMEGSGPMDADDVVELCSTFAILMREQLAATAGRINTIRMDNLRSSQGATYKQDSLDIVDPGKFQEEIKSIRTITNAFKPRRPPQSQHQTGSTKSGNDRSNSNSSNNQQKNNQRYRRNDYGDNNSSFHRDFNNRRGDSGSYRRRDSSSHRQGDSQRRGRSSSRRKTQRESEGDSLSS
ncbi:hypothetical protein BGZ54_003390 [Gamsiella multidivaricata]|nr:hypothetical protein BGZ54_003390 [Gamsiella multidivaricata]